MKNQNMSNSMKTAENRTAIRVGGGSDYILSRQRWGRGDYVQMGYISSLNTFAKTFASPRSAQQWINRYSASVLPAVWGGITLGEAKAQGLLEMVTIDS
jgi:hypothetical protein